MIMRLFLVAGLLLLGGTAYFVVGQRPPTVQVTPTASEIVNLRQEGILPAGIMAENEEIEHEVFGVSPEDKEMIERATENMDMGGMKMEGDGQMEMAEDSGMKAEGDGQMDMAGDSGTKTEGDGQMDMAEGSETQTEGGEQMDMAGESGGDSDMKMEGDADHAAEEAADADHAGEAEAEEQERLMAGKMAGLIIRDDGEFDREVRLLMSEWTFSNLQIDAKPGERIKFTLSNDGKIPHEFMFMSMAAMQGVNYRAKRADWNLLEHEALYEKSLILPGEEITFVAEVLQPGAWMFMCMLPYHMQMGMMGQMATEGMAMQM
ncbi:MAG: multicopper oxidase domain-containing protein [Paracoccaceae bacterium]|nr:multicopper oxidase domain-containing protein [Paracoccaceae bacterium]